MPEEWARGPTKKNEEILIRGLQIINSVPYRVSTRFVFYKLLQEGYYSKKGDYDRFCNVSSIARHMFWGGWRPDSMADEGRGIIRRTGGFGSVEDCVRDIPWSLRSALGFAVDHFYHQEQYVEIWFEAAAMTSQFEYYTHDVDLVPFRGTASNDYKWKIAKQLEEKEARYGKPIKILYFGDCDYYGEIIKDVAELDIAEWSDAIWDLEWCGLTIEQAKKYGIPENPEMGKKFQWEALSDAAAKEIITTAFKKYIDEDVIKKVRARAKEVQAEWDEKISPIIDELEEEFKEYFEEGWEDEHKDKKYKKEKKHE